MNIFNFITDEDFRNSLESDFSEMKNCADKQAWKAVHVLAGSVVEAVLIDYLISEGVLVKKEALSIDLGKAIDICKSNKIISAKSADLSTVIKEYRNLIHPGRAIRLNEMVTAESANVAQSVVQIILGEVSKQRRENYGYTAEQITAKIEKDSSAEAIIPHLLKETNPSEIERLLIRILPERYLNIMDEPFIPDHVIPVFAICFRSAFNQADEKLKKKVAKWLVSVLKEESDRAVFSYGTAFLRASDLEYLGKNDASLVKEHLLSRLKNNPTEHLLVALEGIGEFLTSVLSHEYLDILPWP